MYHFWYMGNPRNLMVGLSEYGHVRAVPAPTCVNVMNRDWLARVFGVLRVRIASRFRRRKA